MSRSSGAPLPAPRWLPRLGSWPDDTGFRFRVWAPTTSHVSLVVDPGRTPPQQIALTPRSDGTFETLVADLSAGARYAYLLDGRGPYPDPASRAQPDGVHGWSQTVSPSTFPWTDSTWTGISLDRAVFYELHVGTFTPAGTFAGVIDRLAHLADLGVTVLELMPVADFPGERNWGYDGVSLFAPARCYGAPDDLRQLVDAAHAHGLAVVLDVVYNHFGPDGAYTFAFSPYYASRRHDSPWGAAVNFDGEHASFVREFVIENALHWLHEYHVDGLRLDATHAIQDDGPTHVLAELAERARASIPHRSLLLVAEDDRNLASIVEPASRGGWELDAVWADDFHHHVQRMAAGDRDGYYMDYSGRVADLAATIRQGWFFTGQYSPYRQEPRGTAPDDVTPAHMVIALQNHDQIGNRAFGDRLNHLCEPRLMRALTVVWLCAPETPLVFMGQEWAASTPFLYFTDHHGELGHAVTEGRRREFSRFTAFADEAVRQRIPDPQAPSTFAASRLRWNELAEPAHQGMHALHRTLLRLRHASPALFASAACTAEAHDEDTLVVTRSGNGSTIVMIARVRGAGAVHLSTAPEQSWSIVLTSDDRDFIDEAPDASPAVLPPDVSFTPAGPVILFHGPAAVMLSST